MGEPFRVMAAGCGGFTSNVYTAPSECNAEPTVVGLMMFRRPCQRRPKTDCETAGAGSERP
jgi:hypothetical protein